MRTPLLALAAIGALALAGAASAQVMSSTMPADVPSSSGGYSNQSDLGGRGEVASRQSRYLMKIETLKEKVAKTKARDGGQLTPEHEASLKHELDKLNRTYGVNQG